MASLSASLILIQASLLGGVSLRVKGEEKAALLQAPTCALLALLVLEGSTSPLSQDRLSRMIWPEYPDDDEGDTRRRNNFRRHWMLLRRAFGPEAEAALLKTRRDVRLNSQLCQTDVGEFRSAAQKGLHGELAALEQASALAEKGGLLPDWEAPWLEAHRVALAKESTAVWLALLDAWEQAGHLQEALTLLERRRVTHPEDERFLRRRWLVLLQRGNEATVKQEVQELLRLGQGEPETRALAERLARELEPSPTQQEPLHCLPLPTTRTRLLGREGVLTLLHVLLPGTRIVTLHGPGGVGKTRLALEAAPQNASRFRDGAAFLDLTRLLPGARPYAFHAELGRAIGLESASETSLYAALRHRELLLVLDNAEHVRELTRQVLSELLSHCPALHLLLTSREPLRLAGERLIPVAALPAEEALSLFWERAPLAQIPQTTAEQAAAQAICARLEGLPLGIELAAASLERFEGLTALAEELAHSFRSLASTTDDPLLPPRAHTLTATIRWSEALRTEKERTLFRTLSVFAGGASLAPLAAIVGWDEPQTQQLAESLVAASLLQSEDPTRWRLAEPLREYAWDRLEEAHATRKIQQAHATWFLGFVEETPPRERVEQERANLERVQAFLLESKQADLAHRLGAALWRFWYQYGSLVAGQSYLKAALLLGASTNTPSRREALLGAANLAYALREPTESAPFGQEALEASRVVGDGVREARALGTLGLTALSAKEFVAARSYFLKAEERFAALGDLRGVRRTRDNLALTATESGDLEEALRLSALSLSGLREEGPSGTLLVALNNAAHLHLQRQEDSEALTYLQEALPLALELRQWRGLLQSLMAVVTWTERQKDYVRCAPLIGAIATLRLQHSQPTPQDAKKGYDALAQRVEEALGTERFAVLQTEGARLPLPELIALAMHKTYSHAF
ncbi:ATP-binding protein [Armatimonas sp.]|uniref:ATP-binding protein n=1 Tax=Armatimonas sp. TaxID=1872638 RepID=UPI003752A4C0